MPDVWGNIGADIAPSDGEWLFREDGQVHGPMPFQRVVQKLIAGEIAFDTPVAKEGGEFYAVRRVAAFEPHLKAAQSAADKRRAAKTRRAIGAAVALVILVMGGVGYLVWNGWHKHNQAVAANLARQQAELARKRKEALAVPEMELVALVTLGELQMRTAPPKPVRKPRRGRGSKASKKPEPPPLVASCNLPQAKIMGTLQKHLGKINLCVEDEKSRDARGLLPNMLNLDFVVRSSGKVVEFQINDRHYRKGPMNNCMIKAFNRIKFPASTGANCPVTIPIKIRS